MTCPIRVAAFYRFAAIADPRVVRAALLELSTTQGVKGTILLAHEGINGTIAGASDAIEAVISHIRALQGCDSAEIKYADADTMPFHRMKIRVKREIVTLGIDGLDPSTDAGIRVDAADWNALITDPDTILIDTRNDYEVAIGSFTGAINPATASFRDFPEWFRSQRETLLAGREKPKIAMFCTGGIRCEKSTALLRSEGIDDVYHLDGGILRYLEETPAAQSLWQGECFVFDERVAVGAGLSPGSHVLCRACRRPVSAQGQSSPLYIEGEQCPACDQERTDADRARYAERHRQVALADKRGKLHIGNEAGANRRR